LGTASVLETGIRLHHTYGVPIIPGSALKGLTAHYCDQVRAGKDGEAALKRYVPQETDLKAARDGARTAYEVLFGSTQRAGHIIFHDAWITPCSLERTEGKRRSGALHLDVMTPHHPRYYAGDRGAYPTDFDDPTPIPFVSATGTFLIAVSCDDPTGTGWAKLALNLLCEALRNWGAGGKTSSGYGRLREPEPEEQRASLAREVTMRTGYEQGQEVMMACVDDPDPKPTRIALKAPDGALAYLQRSEDTPDPKPGDQVTVYIIQGRSEPYAVRASLPPHPKAKTGRPKQPKRGRR